MHHPRMRALFFLVCLFILTPRPAAAQVFQLPLDCAVGSTCIVQNYADWQTGPGARDPMCGPLTYDGHDGLDFRAPLALAARGVAVLAPAAGVVRGVRDGEPDGAYVRGGMAAIAGRDCGNGVVIDHGEGWQSQVCHMRAGTLQVRAGDRVSAGQRLGLVGLSGHTEFPHVHLAVRRNGATLDPLTGNAIGTGGCGANAVRPAAYWTPAARTALAYRGSLWFAAGFTGTAPGEGANAEALPANAARRSAALVFWALASGPRNGDVLRVRLYGPDGALVAEGTRTQPRDQAQAWLFAGRRTPPAGWAAGNYRGVAEIVRGGRVVQARTETITLR
ncbi:M23 family metallopeptidase [Terricaulis sp.]|uniref:M23 family metallopeptidase n=1 Tax=Terricaulis sp. TaxID=2768686 RepID=UPI0037836C00